MVADTGESVRKILWAKCLSRRTKSPEVAHPYARRVAFLTICGQPDTSGGMQYRPTTHLPWIYLATLFAACGDADPTPIIDSRNIIENDVSPSVFISRLDLRVDPSLLESVSFAIRPRPGAYAKPISARFAIEALSAAEGVLQLPIFGLYSDYTNTVDLVFELANGSTERIETTVATGTYVDPLGPYDDLRVAEALDGREIPDFSYMLLENATDQGPIIIDIDGYVRWVGPELGAKWPITFDANRFVAADENRLTFISLAGEQRSVAFAASGIDTAIPHRELAFGPRGYLVSVDVVKNDELETTPLLLEIDENGRVLDEWDFGQIVERYMSGRGDDATAFVRPNAEWFVLNSSVYSPGDNSLIVSSRENFLMKVDYSTKEIRWILGDETKYWSSFASLTDLSIASGDPKPIGQHSLSIVDDGLLLFNNGEPSFRQPNGAPAGRRLTSSLAMIYAIDDAARTADATWIYDGGLFGQLCSSVYRFGRHYLITYSSLGPASGPRSAAIRVINHDQDTLLELEVPATPLSVCRPWNAEIIHLEQLRFDQ